MQVLLTIASLGVGAEPPKEIADGSFKRNQLSSNDRLRQQLLGKHAAKGRATENKPAAASHLPTKKIEKPARPSRVQDDSDDEEDGRAAMFKSKKKTAPVPVQKEESAEDSESESEAKGKAAKKQDKPALQEESRKRPISYLDEILEERSKKKNKKQKAQADQAKLTVKAEPEKTVKAEPEKTVKEEKSKATPVAEEQGADDGEDDSEEETSKSASKPATSTDSVLFDRPDKKKKKNKKKKKKKKNKGEAHAES